MWGDERKPGKVGGSALERGKVGKIRGSREVEVVEYLGDRPCELTRVTA